MALLYAYSFDEASGDILDASGNARTTVLAAPLSRTGSGHTNSGMTSSSSAGASNGPALTGLQTANCTLMCWVRRSDNSQIGWIGELKSGGSGNRGLLLGLSGNASFRCRNSSNTAATPGAAQPAINTWWHLAGTWDGTTVRVFINGTQVASAALSGAPHTGATTSHLFDTIGAETIIDDLRYYDTALDAATITTLMGTPVTSGGSSHSQTPADTEGLTDSSTVDKGKGASDTQALTDAARYDLGKVAADALGATDAIRSDIGKAAADTATLSDAAVVARGIAAGPADTVSLTDSATVARSIALSLVDDLAATDDAMLERAVVQAGLDDAGTTDTAQVEAARAAVASDSENLTDSAALAATRGVTDAIGLTDQITIDRTLVASDNADLTDTISVQVSGAGTLSVSDDQTLTDSTEVTVVRDQAASDTCGLTDQVALVITRDLGDTISVTDAADLTAAFVRVLDDTAALTDSVSVVVSDATAPIPGHLTVANAPGSGLVTEQSGPVLAPSNAPSSQLEVSHGV